MVDAGCRLVDGECKNEVVVVGAFFLLKLNLTLLVVLLVASKLARMAGKRVGR